jgi:hypothetical protein
MSIFESGRNEDRRKLHNEELNDLYSSPSVIGVIKSRKMWRSRAYSSYGEGERRVQEFGRKTVCVECFLRISEQTGTFAL